MALLELKNVTKCYGGLVAVNELSFEVEEHKIHALIGPNGSGKTTTINMINGSLHANTGEIVFNGKKITKLPMYERSRMGIGRTFQNLKLFHTMTVEDNLLVGLYQDSKINMLRFLVDIKGTAAEERKMREKAHEMMEFMALSSMLIVLSATYPMDARR